MSKGKPKDLQSEIRALLGSIGLDKEGETEESVLSRFKGREPVHTQEEDDDVAALIADLPTEDEEEDAAGGEEQDDDNDEEQEEQEVQLTPQQRRAAEKQAKKEAIVAQNAAAQAKAAAAKAAKQPAAVAAVPEPVKGKKGAVAAAATTSTVVSLSRAKAVKEEPAEEEEAEQEEEEEESKTRPLQAKDAFPLNNVTAVPSAAPPRTIPGGNAANLKWYEQAPHVNLTFPAAAKSAQSAGKKVTLGGGAASSAGFVLPRTVEECQTLAQERLAAVVAHFEQVNGGRSSDARWLSTVLTSGTLSDKVAGMTLLVQEAPLYRVAVIDQLLAMAHKQGRRENTMACDALKDLFLNDLLPPRKLIAFAQQPYFKQQQKGSMAAPSETQLTYWALEDALKARYLDFLSVLEEGTHDEMAYIKKARVGQLYELLLGSPERERLILSLLVNKLGDNDKKIGARVVFLLSELVKTHPAFKLALISELEQLLYRSNISKRAQYYAIIFLNQLVFVAGDEALANKLISVYFLLFKQFIASNKTEREEELALEAKRAAKKRARAMAQADAGHKPYKPKKESAPPKKYGGSNSISSKQAAAAGKKKGFVSVEASDALRSKLLGGLLTGINRALPYASPMAVEGAPANSNAAAVGQSGEEAVLAQMDMLFQLVHTTSFPTAIQALMLLYQVLSRSIQAGGGPNTDRFFRALYEKLLAPELLSSASKHGLFLNLLFKALKNDSSAERVAAFAKRLLQVSLQHSPPFMCGVLFLLSEVLKVQRGLAMLITQPAEKLKVVAAGAAAADDSDDEEEHFRDAPEDATEDVPVKPQSKKEPTAPAVLAAKEEKHATPANAEAALVAELAAQPQVRSAYDPNKREPQFAHARSSCLWELLLFRAHYHPSVSRFAEHILAGESITYPGDPLKDFTHMHFLDRFCFKNPKKSKATAEGGKAKPAPGATFTRQSNAQPYTPVNTPAFLARATAAAAAAGMRIADDQQFLARYFTQKSALDASLKRGKSASKELAPDEDDEEAEDRFADELIEREMRKVEPDGWGDADDDEDGAMYHEEGPSDEDGEDGEEDGAGEEGEEGELDFEGDDAPMSDVDDEAAAEAAALAEMEGGGEDDDFSDDDDDDDADEFPLDSDDDESDEGASGGGRDRSASVFASAEEFADLLNSANDSGVSVKQSAWEKRSSIDPEAERAGGRGGCAGKGGAGGGYKSAPKPGGKGGKKGGGGGRGGEPAGRTPEKPSFKRKLAESGGSRKKGAGSNKKGPKRARR